ncbi:ATP-binding protein [Nocardioides bizhenqiangii]|uniref:AAA family ATPase n=1 Tax=Nocardioides bizhenqiangii TaxID=3095076 RepID=A0ABZ0ZKY1_9ACTN|nr:AAA family ATPase [Nocardioides sp. HM61]WQQ24987.1 AAA family ATPase [Nocardioides sp. HM61]
MLGGLPRSDIPPGGQRDLNAALHDLHHRAGWPSLRVLAREAGCSHTTVSRVFSARQLPAWGVLELVVEALGGDVGAFHRLWLAASSPEQTPAPGHGIAGRREELAKVRRHLATGTGLLLITGEAGIGKTNLFQAARTGSDAFLAPGSGLPLSNAVPLLPVASALREIFDHDDGRWLGQALRVAPSYVRDTLVGLLPELSEGGPPLVGEAEWARHRLFTAIEITLAKLAGVRRLALCLEDLHWADLGTLELLEHLLARGLGLPVVGTYRCDDPAVPEPVGEWFNRIQRLPDVAVIELAPLSREETSEQLALLHGSTTAAGVVDPIYSRTLGHPLFTEQLAAQAEEGQPLPRLLVDLLDRRLADLDDHSRTLARALGVADKPLDDPVLRQVTELDATDLSAALHDLDRRRLLAASDGGGEVQLRHPLLAEAVRRDLLAGEAPQMHRRLAIAIGGSPGASAAEVAAHWQGADDPRQELTWRIRAAEEAALRFDAGQEAEQWLKVLALCRRGWGASRTLEVRARLAATDAFKSSLQFDRAAALIEDSMARLEEFEPAEQAEILRRAAGFRANTAGDATVGLELIERALAIYVELPPSDGYAEALDRQAGLLEAAGRLTAASHVVRRAAEVAAPSLDLSTRRRLLGSRAWAEALGGSVPTALATISDATRLAPPHTDPLGDIWVADIHTGILLRADASAGEVVAAGRRGLEAAAATGIENYSSLMVRWHTAEALLREGLIERAADLIDALTEGPFDLDRWPVHLARARLDIMRGDLVSAAAHIESPEPVYVVEMLAVNASRYAEVEIWAGRPEPALHRLLPALEAAAPTEAVSLLADTFVLAARAAGDAGGAEPRRRRRAEALTNLRNAAPVDPFDPRRWPANVADRATWEAELARLVGSLTVEPWVAAATEWNKLNRPFETAYCRWRGAQAAMASGHGTLSKQLLQRAAHGARGHVPLSAAIRDTATTLAPSVGPA